MHRAADRPGRAARAGVRRRADGLGNRRLADETLAEVTELGGALTLAIWDVDGLKVVNDRDGHLAGDRLLREVALLLSEAAALLPGSVATRLGGDEFCLIARDRSEPEVTAVLSGLVERAAGLVAGAGVSSGLPTSAAGAVDARTLLRRADNALYRAKRSGGGRHVRSSDCSADWLLTAR